MAGWLAGWLALQFPFLLMVHDLTIFYGESQFNDMMTLHLRAI